MHPFGLNRIKPRTLAGQGTNDQATGASDFGLAIVCRNPVLDLMTEMPGGVIPDQKQRPFALRRKGAQQPGPKGTGDAAERTALHKAYLHLVQRRDVKSVTGDCLAVRIVFRDVLLDLLQRSLVAPGVHRRLPFAAPPSLIFKAQHDVAVGVRQPDQAVALFFLTRSPDRG